MLICLKSIRYSENRGAPFEIARVDANNPFEITVRNPAGPLETRLKTIF